MSGDLDELLERIGELEAEPEPVIETDDERRARNLAEFDALMAADGDDADTFPWYDSWLWTADPYIDPVHLPPLPPLIRPLPTRRGRRIAVSIPAAAGDDWVDAALAAMTDSNGYTVPEVEFAQLMIEAGWR
ncbi:hypothetical protein KIH27_16115 [Mycobacterium sp. M1]|uniref:Uncharacterized protein n=1 Tax=Mycolicibacter acidiphilus TaxID=2835306 RepID=A0ABS5RQ72_9MYCO|nr:hypothetical protein [Mycolicibacter acidiphilus]MBS9535114.1 hypothetical protein [Mycolicibacter acidiphilus]